MSLADYRDSQKEKNAKLNGPAKAKINVALPSDLKVMEKETLSVKDKKVVKSKKVDNSKQQIAVNFKTEDLSNANARYVKPGFEQKVLPKKTQKATINFADLPTL